MEDINIFSFLIASVIPLAVGYILFNKSLFGRYIEVDYSIGGLIAQILGGVILGFFFLNFNNDVGQEGAFDTFAHGAWHGAFVTVFVVMPILLIMKSYNGQSWKFTGMLLVYALICCVLIGGVMDGMNHWPNEWE